MSIVDFIAVVASAQFIRKVLNMKKTLFFQTTISWI